MSEHQAPDRLLELQTFQSVKDYDGLCELIWGRLSGQADAQVVEALYESLQELAANVLQHSDAPHGFVAAQVYQRETAHESVVFAVGDCGIGVRRSLSSRHKVHTDAEALRMALSYDVSGLGEPGRGQGLPTIAELVGGLGGHVVVHSGGARIVCSRDRRPVTVVSSLAGTLVGGRIPPMPGSKRSQ